MTQHAGDEPGAGATAWSLAASVFAVVSPVTAALLRSATDAWFTFSAVTQAVATGLAFGIRSGAS